MFAGVKQSYISSCLTYTMSSQQATDDVLKDACTMYKNPPDGAAVKPRFCKETYDHARHILEAVSVDSAENEIVSVGDMRSGPAAFAPNCNFTLRDAPHSLRRVPGRLWKCDAVLKPKNKLLCYSSV